MKHTVSMKQNYEFQRLYAKGRSAANGHLVVYWRKNNLNRNRLGLTVGKKVGGAVTRNRVRRRLREIYRLHEAELPVGRDLVIVARVKAAFADYHRLERSFLTLADKLGLRERSET